MILTEKKIAQEIKKHPPTERPWGEQDALTGLVQDAAVLGGVPSDDHARRRADVLGICHTLYVPAFRSYQTTYTYVKVVPSAVSECFHVQF